MPRTNRIPRCLVALLVVAGLSLLSVPDASAATKVRRPTRVLYLGDSVAWSLQDQVGREFRARRIRFTGQSFPGCGVVAGFPVDPDRRRLEACAVVAQRQPAIVRRLRPDAVVAFSTWEARDRVVNGVTYVHGTPEWADQMVRLYEGLLRRVSTYGARLVLVLAPDNTTGGAMSDVDSNEGLHQMNDVIRRFAAAHQPGVRLVDLSDVVCPSTPCPPDVGGVRFRPRDGVHFTLPAANPVARVLAQRIASLDLNFRRR